LSHNAPEATLISVFLAVSQTPTNTAKKTDTGTVHRAVCLFSSQLLLVLIAPIHGGMVRLCWLCEKLYFNLESSKDTN